MDFKLFDQFVDSRFYRIGAPCWLALWILSSIIYRRTKGKPIFRPTFSEPLFLETWRSGRNLTTLFGRFGGARNCLWIAVADGSLKMGAHFPFSLIFLPEIYGFECDVPVSAVRAVEPSRGIFKSGRTIITIEPAEGSVQRIEISLKDSAAFEAALAKVRETA